MTASGALSAHVNYVAQYMEDDLAPLVVVVMRYPYAEYATSASVSGAVSKRGSRTSDKVRVVSGRRDVTLQVDVATRTLMLQGEQIALGVMNLVLCDMTADNQLVPGSVSLGEVTDNTDLRGRRGEQKLMLLPAVRDFVAMSVA